MGASPLTKSIELPSFQIMVGGKKLGDAYFVRSIETEHNIHKIGRAEVILELIYDEAKKKTFEQGEGKKLAPGTAIEIQLGYEQKNKPVFKGIITSQGLRTYGSNNLLILKCCDKAIKLTLAKRTSYFKAKKDNELITKVLSDAGLEKAVDATTVKHPMMLQQNCTDWEFIKMRAAANGLLLYAENNKVFVKKPGIKASGALQLTYGKDVYAMQAETDATFQLPSASCHAWSLDKQAIVKAKSTEPGVNKQGDLTGKKLATAIGFEETEQFLSVPMEKPELEAWANAMVTNSRLSRIIGMVSFIGNADPKLNTLIELKNFNARFNGKALITGVRQLLEKGQWKTTVHFGLKSNFFDSLNKGVNTQAGVIPTVGGLQIGKIKKIDEDPKKEARLQVELPFMNNEAEGVWARLATFFATSGKGAFFIPDVGDEVVVGFLNNDPRHAIIVGMLYSSKAAPPLKLEKENKKKAIVTKEDLTLEFDDEKKVITISTPEGNKITLSEEDKGIVIEDQNGNKASLNEDGISFKTDKDFVVEAGGDVKINSKGNINGKASDDIELKGSKIKVNGSSGLDLKSGSSGSLKASGTLIVKGKMVKIN